MASLVSLVPFVIGSVLITIAPGPDMALITRQVLAHGQRVARATIAGNVTGVLVHTLLVAFGLSAVLLASVKVFDAVKIAGAVYLVYLGVTSIRHARRPVVDEVGPVARSRVTGYRQGLFSTLLNPKPILFLATFLPQFVNPDGNVTLQVLGLGSFHAFVAAVWLPLYAAFVGRLHVILTRRRVRMWFERATGAVLISFGLRLALSHR
jgi:threonine/homoserine/homoserine lactone efflux protein